MYPNMCPAAGTMPMCTYCPMANQSMIQPMMTMLPQQPIMPMMPGTSMAPTMPMVPMAPMMPMMPMVPKPMAWEEEESDDSRVDDETDMPGMMDMSGMDMGKIQAATQDIVNMFEQHHPDIIKALTGCNMSIGQARQYLSRVIQMSIMHHMMHKM